MKIIFSMNTTMHFYSFKLIVIQNIKKKMVTKNTQILNDLLSIPINKRNTIFWCSLFL